MGMSGSPSGRCFIPEDFGECLSFRLVFNLEVLEVPEVPSSNCGGCKAVIGSDANHQRQ